MRVVDANARLTQNRAYFIEFPLLHRTTVEVDIEEMGLSVTHAAAIPHNLASRDRIKAAPEWNELYSRS
jgi:hypothetical protein